MEYVERIKEFFMKTTVLIFLAGLMVGFGGGWRYAYLKMPANNSADNTKTIKGEKNIPGREGNPYLYSVYTENQSAGIEVLIKSASIERTAWVAIREDVQGEMGNILGAKRLDAGVYNDVKIDLLRPTSLGGVYHAVIYEDDGDFIFDHANDILIEVDQRPVESVFQTK